MNVYAWLCSFSFISFVKASFYKARSFINLRIHFIISTYIVLSHKLVSMELKRFSPMWCVAPSLSSSGLENRQMKSTYALLVYNFPKFVHICSVKHLVMEYFLIYIFFLLDGVSKEIFFLLSGSFIFNDKLFIILINDSFLSKN